AGEEVRRFSQDVVFDGNPPDRVQLLDVPVRAARGQPLTVTATGQDLDSGIQQVLFFVGKPVAGKPPPTATTVPGQVVPGTTSLWTASLPLPPGAQGPTDVTVQFVNGVGLSA